LALVLSPYYSMHKLYISSYTYSDWWFPADGRRNSSINTGNHKQLKNRTNKRQTQTEKQQAGGME